MERVEGPQTPYEVYCYDCRVTFAAGTRRCVHCGGRVGSRAAGPVLAGATQLPDDPTEPSIGRRLGGMSLWLLLAVGAALSRMCAEG
jgi:hypothetical protein